MQKKEIAEIKKQFKYDDALTRIAGCFVDAEKNIISVFSKSFASLDDTDRLKYMAFFKKVLSGTKGTQLNDAEFPIHAEDAGSTHAELMELLHDELKDEDNLRDFFERVVGEYQHEGNYCIFAAHDNYDVPGKGSDGLTMDDASDTVHSFMIFAICPVDLAKAGLSYHEADEMFLSMERDWMAKAPEYGFTFPAFDDRMTNIHAMLVYDNKSEREDFTTGFFNCTIGASSEKQSETFATMVYDAFGKNLSVKTVADMMLEVSDMTDANPELENVNCARIIDIFEACGADTDNTKKCAETFTEELGRGAEININNVLSTKALSIEGEGIKIKADSSYAEKITEEIDSSGIRYLKIPIGLCTVNGINVANW